MRVELEIPANEENRRLALFLDVGQQYRDKEIEDDKKATDDRKMA